MLPHCPTTSSPVTNILVDPLAFLLLNGAAPPPHWFGELSANTSIPSSSLSTSVPFSYTAADWLFTSAPGLFGLVSGWALPTGEVLLRLLLLPLSPGVFMCLVLAVMVICSMKWVRESGNFEVRLSVTKDVRRMSCSKVMVPYSS